ncbi:error-prone DNA polymerase [Clostridiales bacterium CHKCI001]|nr:error-prone DNA polymerase [Clostridiales bacterium CHKCI001]
MKRDLHLHTYCSDGCYEVEEVVKKAKEYGLEQIAITDHDTIEGIIRARLCAGEEIECISGIEFTCQDQLFSGQEERYSIHLLGYGFDETNLKLCKRLEKRNMQVRACYKELLHSLRQYGIDCCIEQVPISWGTVMQLRDIQTYLSNKFSENPKIMEAKHMVASYAESLIKWNIPVEEAIQLVHEAGGKAVWAHPFCVYQQFQKRKISFMTVQKLLDALQKMGVDGIEADYLDFSEQERKVLREEAKKRMLFITAGSDFHGKAGRDRMINVL